MKSIVSSSVLILAAVLPLAKASPANFARGYSAPGYGPQSHLVPFDCSDDVPNWVIDVGFGTPSQPASLLLDTTFDSTFVAGVMCHSDFCEDQKGPLYNAGKSSTSVNLHQRKTFDLGDDKIVSSDLYKDTLNFDSFSYTNFTFGKAFDVQGFPPVTNFAGVYGLSALNSTFRKRAKDVAGVDATQGDGDKKYLQRAPPNGGERKRSNEAKKCIFFPNFDSSIVTQKIFWLDSPTCEYGKSPFWKTDLTCVTIDGAVDLKFKNTIAEFDTTVKNIEMPHEDIQKIHQGLHATYYKSLDRWLFKCCDAKDLKISFAKYAVTFPSDFWTFQEDNDGELCSAIFSISKTNVTPENRWRLGTRFINHFLTISDKIEGKTGISLLEGAKGVTISSK